MPLIPESVRPHIRRFGWSGVLAVGLVVVMLAGVNPITLISGQVAPPPPPTSITGVPAATADAETLAAYPPVVGGEAELMWRRAFRLTSMQYPDIALQTVPDRSSLGCGLAGKDVTVVYCPAERTVYVDLAAYAALRAQFPLGADYALALLVGEAYGEHVQQVLGTFERIAELRASDRAAAETLEKRADMQQACYGAMWAKTAGLEPLYDNAAVVAALRDVESRRRAVLPSVAASGVIPELLEPASFDGKKTWFDVGYAIPAGGNCGLDKIEASGDL